MGSSKLLVREVDQQHDGLLLALVVANSTYAAALQSLNALGVYLLAAGLSLGNNRV